LFKEKRSVIYPPPNYKEEVLEVAENFFKPVAVVAEKIEQSIDLSVWLSV
jgi:hypothetical protein